MKTKPEYVPNCGMVIFATLYVLGWFVVLPWAIIIGITLLVLKLFGVI